ncbi:MAG: two-component sensor histidine kinase, partial [Burkholderiaceae bacterium]|nr:two-component sensor histidine kinase [Burkholderiaceae bacterium]
RLDDSFCSLEQFSADIAHELRTPLNSLLLTVEVTLSRERSGAEYRDALHETMQELGHLQKMVSDMLFIARAERGLAALSVDEVDLLAEVRDVVEYFEPLAGDRGLRTSIRGHATVTGDRSMIRRVATNLLSNAVRYALPDTTIEVKLASQAGAARLTVTNRCETLTQAQADRLFDRFARGESARADAPEGAGLGLAIVRSVMALHGGDVEARAAGGEIAIVATWPPPGHTAPRPLA